MTDADEHAEEAEPSVADGTSDEFDEFDANPDAGSGTPAAPVTVTLTANQIGIIGGIVVVIVVVLIVALIAKGGGGSSSNSGSGLIGSNGTAETSTTAVKKRWPPEVGGRPPAFGQRNEPAGEAGDAQPGLYLWNDFDGWHLWVVRGPGVEGVTGTIASTADVTKAVSALPDDPGASIKIDGKAISFDFSNGTAPVEGVDFNPGFRVESLVVTATAAGSPLPADSFHVGKAMTVEALPYTVSVTAS